MNILENESFPEDGRERKLAVVDVIAALLVIGEDDCIAAAYMTNRSEHDIKKVIDTSSCAYFYADCLLDRMAYYSQMRCGYADKHGYRVTKKSDSYDDEDIAQAEEISLRNRIFQNMERARLSKAHL